VIRFEACAACPDAENFSSVFFAVVRFVGSLGVRANGTGAAKPASDSTVSDSREGSNNQKDWHFIGHVEYEVAGSDTKVYADDMMMYTGENKALATGNVVLAQGDNRISAEHAEFDTKTGLGTFYNATGFSTVKPPKVQPPRAGAMAPPPVIGQDTVVIFFGEKIEKIGPEEIPDYQRRLLDLHAADAALGSERRHGAPERRSLHRAEERGASGQRRADVLHADPVLPDQARRPRHRVPDADLRLRPRCEASRCPTSSSGRSTGARTSP
jgi:lipopolysaccharide export system protein LptA